MKSRKLSRSKKNRRSKKTKLNRSRIFVDGGLNEDVSKLKKQISESQKYISGLQQEIEKKDLDINNCSRKKEQYTEHFEKLTNERIKLNSTLSIYNQIIKELEYELEYKLDKIENPEN